jgi:fatty acid desaturase
MLTVSTLGMCAYGVYSVGWAVLDLLRGARLEPWAELGLIVFGTLLVLAAAFVRVRLPGGLAFAVGALLGLQALAVHDAVHLAAGATTEIVRAVVALVLVLMAYVGGLSASRT